MSGISRLGNKIYDELGLDAWGQREIIPNDFNKEIIETNQELQPGAIDSSKIKNLTVDTITVSPSGYIKSGKTSFTDSTNAGWFQSALGIYYGSAADASYLKYTVSTGALALAGGTITGGSINVPNDTTPLFSVDSAGNCKVKSLARDDFHFFTIFESITGYSVTNGGAGTTVAQDGGLYIVSGITTNDISTFKRSLVGGTTWDKARKFKTFATFGSNVNQIIIIATGDISPTTDRHFGFRVSNAALYGTCGDGTYEDSVNLSTNVSAGTGYILEAVHDIVLSEIRYYVDGVYKNKNIFNLPTGSTGSDWITWVSVKNTNGADGAKTLGLGWYDYWQAN